MFKRKDNDIFGTAGVGFAPRIQNDNFVDPHAAFRQRTEENYQKYSATLSNFSHVITHRPVDSTKVNEDVVFEEDYHRNRKEMDLQSSIFYPPIEKHKMAQSRQKTSAQNDPSTANHAKNQEASYGRRETIKREMAELPYNATQMKGNSSRLFGLDDRILPKSEQTIPMAPLIPNRMQWDQHDSIKYSHINFKAPQNKIEKGVIENVEESHSTVFTKEDIKDVKTQTVQPKTQTEKVVAKKQQKANPAKKVDCSKSQPVQIRIVKGWDGKFMQGLSKHCKLSGSNIIKFQLQAEGKATLVIKRSQRWQNLADWLRKDCKLKLRVTNP